MDMTKTEVPSDVLVPLVCDWLSHTQARCVASVLSEADQRPRGELGEQPVRRLVVEHSCGQKNKSIWDAVRPGCLQGKTTGEYFNAFRKAATTLHCKTPGATDTGLHGKYDTRTGHPSSKKDRR